MNLQELIARIAALDAAAMQAAASRQDRLTKPRASLGRLEDLSVQIAGITGNPMPRLEKKAVFVMAGDHGVVEEGVSAYPQDVTRQMVLNFVQGGAAINVFARQAGARVVVVDMGVASDLPADSGVIIRKIGRGTADLAKGPAMTGEQAVASILAGAQVVEEHIAQGLDIIATGDMGIGNTTPSTAIAAVLCELPVESIVGRGTGVDDDGLRRKQSAIRQGLELNHPDRRDGLDVLAKVGGFEIGGLAGAILAAAAHRKPVVIDGFISTAAALVAVCLAPAARDYMIAAHVSQEQGHRAMLNWLRLEPLLDLRMRLGEGTGAVLAMHVVDAACRALTDMATFDEAGVSEKDD
ncbi:MAG TPA: nicotinate-nucleotide--dimethylbenzimidazole phosphoribosyltransferase [Anaerolineales bacterium]|nr:nicotinate-nucleotide--dimethylbenzimidazole phosphoribosyltransferase [Anaerolineales bacterium]